jgi:hypothetical protein
MLKQRTNRRLFRQPVQQPEIVDHAVVTRRGDFDPSLVELAPVRFALVAQDVAFRDLYQRRRQSLKLFDRCLQGRCIDFFALVRVSSVEVPHPLHQRRGEETLLAELFI